MNKKEYKKPTMKVVQLHQRTHLLSGSVRSIESGTTNLKFGRGGSGNVRSREFGDWDDWDEE